MHHKLAFLRNPRHPEPQSVKLLRNQFKPGPKWGIGGWGGVGWGALFATGSQGCNGYDRTSLACCTTSPGQGPSGARVGAWGGVGHSACLSGSQLLMGLLREQLALGPEWSTSESLGGGQARNLNGMLRARKRGGSGRPSWDPCPSSPVLIDHLLSPIPPCPPSCPPTHLQTCRWEQG